MECLMAMSSRTGRRASLHTSKSKHSNCTRTRHSKRRFMIRLIYTLILPQLAPYYPSPTFFYISLAPHWVPRHHFLSQPGLQRRLCFWTGETLCHPPLATAVSQMQHVASSWEPPAARSSLPANSRVSGADVRRYASPSSVQTAGNYDCLDVTDVIAIPEHEFCPLQRPRGDYPVSRDGPTHRLSDADISGLRCTPC